MKDITSCDRSPDNKNRLYKKIKTFEVDKSNLLKRVT